MQHDDSMIAEMARARREELRWVILRALNAAHPMGTTETVVMSAIAPLFADVTTAELRREIAYLEERGLIEIGEKRRPIWQAKINRHGIDIVEYTVDCQPGIARPEQW